MAEHRVSMLGASLRRYEDPARSADPRIRRLVAQLATLEPAPAPRAHFRAELRAQLVAVAPRLIAEGPAVEAPRAVPTPATPAPAGAKSSGSRLNAALGWAGRISLARPIALVTTVIVVFAVLLGGAVWISKKALPGDTLYSLKRANENVALSLATGDTAKGREYLDLAQTRAGEVSALLSRSSATADGTGPSAAGGVNSHTADLITATLASADSDTRNGSRLLAGQAVHDGSAEPLSFMTGWAPNQIERLQSISDRLSAGALHDRAAASAELAANALSRAQALQAALPCDCLDKAAIDDLGPVPTTVPAPSQSTAPTTSNPPSSTKGGNTHPKATGSGGTTPTGPVSVRIDPGTGSGSGSGTQSGTSVNLPIQLPPLPIKLPAPTQSTPGGTSGSQTCSLSVLGICLIP